jgi:hypothetical protein
MWLTSRQAGPTAVPGTRVVALLLWPSCPPRGRTPRKMLGGPAQNGAGADLRSVNWYPGERTADGMPRPAASAWLNCNGRHVNLEWMVPALHCWSPALECVVFHQLQPWKVGSDVYSIALLVPTCTYTLSTCLAAASPSCPPFVGQWRPRPSACGNSGPRG